MPFIQLQFRRDTSTNWTSANPILLSGEMGIETDTKNFKIGDGTTNWNDLSYGGIQGFTGSSGAFAAVGFTGSQGSGFTGSQGDIGYTGSQGDIGFTGSKGDIGYTGSKGDIGYTGSQGDIGYTGSQGDIGFTGSKGDIGYTGSQGDTGFTGSQGIQGEQGVGFTGSQGEQGPAGGYTGSQGVIGYTGSQGLSGITWEIKTANFDATDNHGYFVNTTSGPITATLPVSATLGDEITFNDGNETFDTNNFTIARNGHKIQGREEDLIISIENSGFTLVYYNIEMGWKLKDK